MLFSRMQCWLCYGLFACVRVWSCGPHEAAMSITCSPVCLLFYLALVYVPLMLRPHLLLRRCPGCGLFEMHPAAIGCYASSPEAADTWYDPWLVCMSYEMKHQAGVASCNMGSVYDQVRGWAEQQQATPRQVVPTNHKTFGRAMRHAHFVQHRSNDPASCGADIFDTAVGQCPPCAAFVLQRRQQCAGPSNPAAGSDAAVAPLQVLAAVQAAATSVQAEHAAGSGIPAQEPGTAQNEATHLGNPEPSGVLNSLLEAVEQQMESEALAAASSQSSAVLGWRPMPEVREVFVG
jgi:hypothetical protein